MRMRKFAFEVGIAVWLLGAAMLSACNLPATPAMSTPVVANTPLPAAQVTTPPAATPTPPPCGEDTACLIRAAQTCTPQEGDLTLSMEMGAQATVVYHFTIEGMQGGQCVFDVGLTKADLVYSEELRQQMKAGGMTDEQIEQQRQQALDAMRSSAPSGKCTGSADDLAALLQRWQEGSFSLDDWAPFTCRGEGFTGQGGEIVLTAEVTAEIALTPMPSSSPNATASSPMPVPQLTFVGKHPWESAHYKGTEYIIAVTNWDAFSPDLFALRPDLPPCGKNPKASRTWVKVKDADSGKVVYSYCAISQPKTLAKFSFRVLSGTQLPRHIVVEFWDRATDTRVVSNVVAVP